LPIDTGRRLIAPRRQPKYAPTLRERAKRAGSSMAVWKKSAVTGPTPGTPMTRWQTASRTAICATTLCSRLYSSQSAACARSMASVMPASKQVAGHQLAHLGLESSPPDGANAQHEHLDRVPDRVLEVEEFALEGAPVPQQQPQPIALVALHMHRLEPARAHKLGDVTGVVHVGLVALRLQCRMHMPRLQAEHRQPIALQPAMQPRRQVPRTCCRRDRRPVLRSFCRVRREVDPRVFAMWRSNPAARMSAAVALRQPRLPRQVRDRRYHRPAANQPR
jgi:hypothetical protein